MFSLIAAMQSLPQETNLMIATAVSAGIGLVYPWNAKFGYLTDGKLPTKYPMVSAWLLLPGALWAAKRNDEMQKLTRPPNPFRSTTSPRSS